MFMVVETPAVKLVPNAQSQVVWLASQQHAKFRTLSGCNNTSRRARCIHTYPFSFKPTDGIGCAAMNGRRWR
jgi:hypothetical protein